MKLTIIPSDSFISVDGDSSRFPIDLTLCNIPQEVHALQWFETKGWVEYEDPTDPFAGKPPNEEITVLPEWANACVLQWQNWSPPELPLANAEENQPMTTGTQEA